MMLEDLNKVYNNAHFYLKEKGEIAKECYRGEGECKSSSTQTTSGIQ
jgi:hypothetical protein